MHYVINNISSATQTVVTDRFTAWYSFKRFMWLMHKLHLYLVHHAVCLTTSRISSRGVSLSRSSQPSW